MSWLSKALGGIHLDSHTLGNVLKDLSPAAALIPGVGPLAAAGLAAGGSALGDVMRGKSPSLTNAVTNAGLGYGASNLIGGAGLGGGGSASGSAAGSVAPSAAPGAVTPPSTVSIGGVSLPGPSAAALPASPPVQAPGFLSSALGKVGNAAGKVGNFVEKNPTASAMGLQGIGNIASAGARNRLAQTEADAAQYDLDAKKRRDTYLSQYLNQYGGLGGNFAPAPNPYTGRAT